MYLFIHLYYLYIIYVHHVINYVYIISKHYTSLWHHHLRVRFIGFYLLTILDLSGFENAMGMLWCILEGGWESWAANVAVSCFFNWWQNWEIFYIAAFRNRQFDIFFMIYVNLSGEIGICPLQTLSPIAGLAFPSNRHFARRCGHVLGVVSVTFVTWWWVSTTFSRKQTAHSLDFTGGSNCEAELGCGFKCFYFHPCLGKWSNLSNMFQMGWNHQLVKLFTFFFGWGFGSTSVRHDSWWNKFQDSFCWFVFCLLLWLMLLSFTYMWQYLIRHF